MTAEFKVGHHVRMDWRAGLPGIVVVVAIDGSQVHVAPVTGGHVAIVGHPGNAGASLACHR